MALLCLFGCLRPPEEGEGFEFFESEAELCSQPTSDVVADVVDGDTVDLTGIDNLELDGVSGVRIRMLGVDTPEVYDDNGDKKDPPDCWGPEASDFTKSMLRDHTAVTVEFDQDCADTYGRALVYLYVDENLLPPEYGGVAEEGMILFNELLLREGYARWFDEDIEHAQDIRERERLLAAEAAAQADGLGLWSACP